MKVYETKICGCYVVSTEKHVDHRGSFTRLFCDHELEYILNGRRIVQINHSRTLAVGAVRGMHYQLQPFCEMKMVRCLKGVVWDVVLDLREGSNTFLEWYADKLTPDNARMMVVPEGCAHGFQVLEEDSELLYLHTNYYAKEAEHGVRADDPRVDIKWPLNVSDISARDLSHAFLTEDYRGIKV